MPSRSRGAANLPHGNAQCEESISPSVVHLICERAMNGIAHRLSAINRHAELKPLVGGSLVEKMFKYDSDPAHNPQPPRLG
jgi:hypothetical protein